MIDFPSNPTVDDEFAAGGITYVWNGQGWTVKSVAGEPSIDSYTKQESDSKFVDVIGDTMSGALHIDTAAGAHLDLGSVASRRGVWGYSGSSSVPANTRWGVVLGDAATENGANAGSNFLIERYTDGGVLLDIPLSIDRASGNAAVSVYPTAPNHIASKSYVDASISNKVSKTGDTMSGGLTVSMSGPTLTLNKPDDSWNCIYGNKNNSIRWRMDIGDGGAETGANAGSGFALHGFSDAGALLATPISCSRAGATTIGPLSAYSVSINTSLTVYGASNLTGLNNSGYFTNSGGMTNTGDAVFNSNLSCGGSFTCSGNFTLIGSGTTSNFLNVGENVAVGVNRDAGATLWFGNSWTKNINYNGNAFIFNGTHVDIQYNCTVHGMGYFNGSNGWNAQGFSGSSPYWVNNLQCDPNWGAALVAQGLHYPSQWVAWLLGVGTAAFQFRNNGIGYCSSGQTIWGNTSDERIKNVVGDYKHGLAEIVALNPIRYTYKGNDTMSPPSEFKDLEDKPKGYVAPATLTAPFKNSMRYGVAVDNTEYVGLTAQNTEITLPEIVTKTKGYIDGVAVDDLREVNYTPLIFALVNAVKELKAELDALKAQRA